MPFQESRWINLGSIALLVLFLIGFFILSKWGDLHYSSMVDERNISNINMLVFLLPIFLIYALIHMTVLIGKPRIKEIDKKLLLYKLRLIIRKKLEEGITEYHQWKTKR
jgi:ABC-type uncharacterized transport system fused permease/ATPase subunit